MLEHNTSPAQRRVRFRRFCFTVNGNERQLEEAYNKLKKLTPTWLIVAREECPMTGRKHLQGACVLGRQMDFNSIKKIPGLERAHIEAMKGSPADSLKYCSKEDRAPYQYGAMPQAGKRNDLHAAIDMLKTGMSVEEMIKSADTPVLATFVRYPRGLTRISQTFNRNTRRTPPLVVWIHGSTGTGKTRSVHEFAELCGSELWKSSGSLQWFDAYESQPIACFDDYRTDHAKFSFVLQLLDRYPLRVPIKGSFVDWLPIILFVTAPQPPRIMWNLRTAEALDQLCRRITLEIDADDFTEYGQYYAKLLESIRGVISANPDFSHLGELLKLQSEDRATQASISNATTSNQDNETDTLIISTEQSKCSISDATDDAMSASTDSHSDSAYSLPGLSTSFGTESDE